MKKQARVVGPSASELKMRSDLDRARRDLTRAKKDHAAAMPAPAAPQVPDTVETDKLRLEVEELTNTRQRLSRLYFTQVEENRKRAHKLHEILESIGQINSDLDLGTLLQRIADTICTTLGFRVVLIRLREPGTARLRAQAFAGIEDAARVKLAAEDVQAEEFMSWLRDEFKISRSYFISHASGFSESLPSGHVTDLGPRGEWEWHPEDVLLVPLFNRAGELIAYFSVDDPIDRLVPSSEAIELLEIFGNHAVVAIENARLYHQLESHSRELEAAGKRMQEMHALKSNFVSTVSHELRTPLTAIRAYLDTLIGLPEGELTHAQLKHFLAIINEESQRLARLIESVLDLNRFESGTMRLERQPVDLAEVCDALCHQLWPMAEAGYVSLKVVNEAADTLVDADPDQMKQMVLHLGSNAVKFTPPGGAVTFRLSGEGADVVLRVEDTGIGIPEDALERVFDRFYQVDSSLARRYGGTGLGLAICKSIVEWHSGRVWVESTEGNGACFTVTLPKRTRPCVIVRPGTRAGTGAEDVLKLAIEMVAEVMNARVVSMLVPDAEGGLVVQAAVGLDESIVRATRIPAGTGIAGWVAEQRRPLCVSTPDQDPELPRSGRPQYRSGSFVSVPLQGEDGELLGVLNVTDPASGGLFDDEDCHLLLHLAERVSAAWERVRSMESSQGGVENTTHALRQVIRHLERGRRIAPDRVRLARTLARELRLPDSQIGIIGFAASVHDIGMTKLGERVLERGGSLTPEERATMEQHTEIGADLLRPLETMDDVREIVRSHHEWWDGTGYPRGLKGDEIPIGGRILAVVDAYESMTVGRAHRAPRSRDEALEELRRLAGRQFDPAVVDAFESTTAETNRPHHPGGNRETADAGR